VLNFLFLHSSDEKKNRTKLLHASTTTKLASVVRVPSPPAASCPAPSSCGDLLRCIEDAQTWLVTDKALLVLRVML
jgi:hypothetical protein